MQNHLAVFLSSLLFFPTILWPRDFPHSLVSKESAFNAGDPGLIPGSGRSSGEGNGNPFQHSHLENPMDRRAWRTMVPEVTKSQTQLSNWARTQHIPTNMQERLLCPDLSARPGLYRFSPRTSYEQRGGAATSHPCWSGQKLRMCRLGFTHQVPRVLLPYFLQQSPKTFKTHLIDDKTGSQWLNQEKLCMHTVFPLAFSKWVCDWLVTPGDIPKEKEFQTRQFWWTKRTYCLFRNHCMGRVQGSGTFCSQEYSFMKVHLSLMTSAWTTLIYPLLIWLFP